MRAYAHAREGTTSSAFGPHVEVSELHDGNYVFELHDG